MAGALDVISLGITKFRVGNHCCCELGGNVTALAAAQPYPSRGACNLTDGQPLIAQGAIRDGGGSWAYTSAGVSPSLMSGGSP